MLANFLFRWGPWVGVLVSAAIFAVAHGINSVMPLAFVIGLATGLLLRFSDSIWPGILVHMGVQQRRNHLPRRRRIVSSLVVMRRWTWW